MRRGKNESLLLMASLCLFGCESQTTAINGATLAAISVPPAGSQPTPTPSSSPSPAPTPSPSPSPRPPYIPGPVDVIVGYGGTIGYSLDKGKTYQVSNYGETKDDCWLWRGMTYGNGVWVAVSYTGGFGAIITSPDGVHWRHYEGKGAESIGFGNGLFVADSFTSTDGYNFDFRSLDFGTAGASVGGHAAIAYVGTNYVISGDQNGIAYGTDGTNFTISLQNYTGTQYNSGIDSFAVNGTDIVGVGLQRLAFSTNSGESWTNYELSTQTFAPFDTNSALRSVIYDGSQFVIYGGDGNYSATTTIWKSTNGTTWTAVSGNTPSFVGGSLLTGFFGLNNGAPNVTSNWMVSSDGLNWSTATSWTESPALENYGIQARVGGIAYSDPSTTPTFPAASIEYTDQQLTAVGCGIPPGR